MPERERQYAGTVRGKCMMGLTLIWSFVLVMPSLTDWSGMLYLRVLCDREKMSYRKVNALVVEDCCWIDDSAADRVEHLSFNCICNRSDGAFTDGLFCISVS